MAQLLPNIAPFWYKPDGQEGESQPAEFRIRPLTQPDLLDVESTYGDDGRPTSLSWLRACDLGVIEVRNLYDEQNRKALWPQCRPRVPRAWLLQLGAKVVMATLGHVEDEPEGDPEKNS